MKVTTSSKISESFYIAKVLLTIKAKLRPSMFVNSELLKTF